MHRRCGAPAESLALVAERGLALKTPLSRVVIEDVPIPFSIPLENHVGPSKEKIAAATCATTGA